MMPLRSITSRTITAPASLVRRSTRASITTPALKLGWKVDGVSPMGCSALADIAAQTPESATHLAQEPAQSAVSTNIVGSVPAARPKAILGPVRCCAERQQCAVLGEVVEIDRLPDRRDRMAFVQPGIPSVLSEEVQAD